jgi:flagellar P-ring protein precursor FlgI
VEVASIGDAKSLESGTLLLTPLRGADGEIYALAQGQVIVGGYEARGQGARQIQNTPTVGRILNSAIVERSLPEYPQREELFLYLDNPSFSLAKHIQDRINIEFWQNVAQALDSSTIKLKVPQGMSVVYFLARVEDIEVDVPSVAKVLIDERTGTVLLGGDVVINPISVAVGRLTVTIKETRQVFQAPPLSPRQTVVVPRTEVKVEEKERHLVELRGATVSQLVESLNKLGATPRQIISILQAIKSAGALRAKLEVL